MHFAIEKKIFIFAIMKLSIIIPVYNTEQTLEKCVDSVLQSSLNNFEIILVSHIRIVIQNKFRLFIKKIKDFQQREMQD